MKGDSLRLRLGRAEPVRFCLLYKDTAFLESHGRMDPLTGCTVGVLLQKHGTGKPGFMWRRARDDSVEEGLELRAERVRRLCSGKAREEVDTT